MTTPFPLEADFGDQQYQADLETVRQRIMNFATPKVGRDIAEDIAQECLILLTQRYLEIRDVSRMTQIAVGIARNKMLERFRQAKREVEFPDDIPCNDDILRELERKQVMDRLLPAILSLGERCRAVLRLRLLEEKSSNEIQKVLGANSINTIYTWEHRCFKQLMEMLGGTVYV